MVSLGFKIDYVKDMIFNLINLGWMIWGEITIFVSHFAIADMIDVPIKCVFDESTPRGREIQSHCKSVEGVGYVIPQQTFESERFWFDFLGTNGAWIMSAYTLVLFGWFLVNYCILLGVNWTKKPHTLVLFGRILDVDGWEERLKEKKDTMAKKMSWIPKKIVAWFPDIIVVPSFNSQYSCQLNMDIARSWYFLIISYLSFNFFFLYARLLNKLSAFGVWQHVGAMTEVEAKLEVGVDEIQNVIQDVQHSDFESLMPDFSVLFALRLPTDTEDPQYIGEYIHFFVIFVVITLTKNLFMATVTSLTDDLHIISLFVTGIPAFILIWLFLVPYLSALYVFKNVDYYYSMRFEFDFGHVPQTALYGGIIFGGFSILPGFYQIALGSLNKATAEYDTELQTELEDNRHFDPSFPNKMYFAKAVDKWKAYAAWTLLATCGIAGIIGLSCLCYAANQVDQAMTWAPMKFVIITWVITFVFAVSSRVCLYLCWPGIQEETENEKKESEQEMEELKEARIEVAQAGRETAEARKKVEQLKKKIYDNKKAKRGEKRRTRCPCWPAGWPSKGQHDSSQAHV